MKIGILGAGQLAMMLAQAGRPLGHEFRFLDPTRVVPARGLGEHIRAPYDEPVALRQFSVGLDVVTYEFENVPVESARYLEKSLPVYPPPLALEKCQDRLVEKGFASDLGLKTPPYRPIGNDEELEIATEQLGIPYVMKSCRFGYDGKGQELVRDDPVLAADAWERLRCAPCIGEAWVKFDRELSLISVRSAEGEIRFYPLVQNKHEGGILKRSVAPAPDVLPALQGEAERLGRLMLEALGYVGVLAIEFFERDGELLFNEMAPRVHNSGHWSIEGAACSQFENHIRAITGAALGDCSITRPSVMYNIIGNWTDLPKFESRPGAHVHDYRKEPRPGRKLGHITVVAQ